MVSRVLMGVWATFSFLLLAAGVVSLVLSILWKAPNVLLNMVLSPADLTAGTILGIALLVTFAISVGGIIQRKHVNTGLYLLNYALLVDAIGVVIIGTFVWWFTLKERSYFHTIWLGESANNRITLQDKFQCCGFFNGTDGAVIGGTFCTSQNFVNSLNSSVATNFCVTPIANFADWTLNSIFTTVYSFMAVIICLLLATICIIKRRQEEVRFQKIDEKRGGGGFV